MLPKSHMNDSILAAYRAGKSAERFFDRHQETVPGDAAADSAQSGDSTRPESDWHH
ncbi:MAG: hypothetical protein K0R39_3000 [Symbiobacteriaceae bacterium]|nr:hypothetical protein [Symbiobacteriaceae bacterium]